MKTSCGVIIVNEKKEILMGHVTGQKFHDIPKGLLEENESELVCAIRECEEETALVLDADKLTELGLFKYNKEKNLHLFVYPTPKESINMTSLSCKSLFEHFYTKKLVPEVDAFLWVPFSEVELFCAKSMSKLLKTLISENKLNFNT